MFPSGLPCALRVRLLHPPLCFQLCPLPELPLRHLTLYALFHLWHCLPDVRRGEKVQYCLARPWFGKELVSLQPPPALSRLLPHLLPQHLLLFSPLRAPLQEVLPRLPWVQAPPALGCWPALCPVEVFASTRVPCLQLVEPSSEPLGTTRNRAVWPLDLWHSVFLLGGPASSPLPCLCPLLLGDLPLDVGEGSGERCWALLWQV